MKNGISYKTILKNKTLDDFFPSKEDNEEAEEE
jgi:hypothetical protein